MTNVSRCCRRSNPPGTLQPDLFSWRSPVLNAGSHISRKLAERYGLSLPHAATVAHLAGLGVEQ